MRYKVTTFITLLIPRVTFARERLLSDSHVRNWKSIVVQDAIAQVIVHGTNDYTAVNSRARVLTHPFQKVYFASSMRYNLTSFCNKQ